MPFLEAACHELATGGGPKGLGLHVGATPACHEVHDFEDYILQLWLPRLPKPRADQFEILKNLVTGARVFAQLLGKDIAELSEPLRASAESGFRVISECLYVYNHSPILGQFRPQITRLCEGYFEVFERHFPCWFYHAVARWRLIQAVDQSFR